MKITTVKLGTKCRDKATGMEGMITISAWDMSYKGIHYLQPRGINPENGHPVERIPLEQERLDLPDGALEEIELPDEILGSTVTDKASSFTGMAVGFVRHMSGCFHVTIQPPGCVKKTGASVRRMDFDLRQCEGEKILQLEGAELEKSKVNKPSPAEFHHEDRYPAMPSAIHD